MTWKPSHLAICTAFLVVATAASIDSSFAEAPNPAKRVTAAMLPVVETNPMATNLTLGIYRSDGDSVIRKLAAYATDASGQWILPTALIYKDARHIPLTLRTPRGSVRIRLSVFLDGSSPEQATDNLLDQAIARAGSAESIGIESERVVSSQAESEEDALTTTEEPTVTPVVYSRDSVLTKLERLVRATGAETADREELKWMLDQWRPGPLWLITRDSISPPRQLVAPLLRWIDSDQDGIVQESEWQGLPKRLKRLDSNRDRIVVLTELEKNLDKSRPLGRSVAPLLDWNLAWESPGLSQPNSENHKLMDILDIVVNVRSPGVINQVATMVDEMFSTQVAEQVGSQIAVQSQHGSVSSLPNGVQAVYQPEKSDSKPAVRLAVRGYVNEGLTSVAGCQVSIAAKVVQNPIWNVLDTNSDGRLVEVEQRNASKAIKELDLNKDGVVSPSEWPLTFQLVVCQGSDAADQLKSVASGLTSTPNIDNAPVPDWFTGMDSNQDGSLSRDEFLGSTKQFKSYDQDGDGLLVPAETTEPSPNNNE